MLSESMLIESMLVAMAGGIVGALMMDGTDIVAHRLGLTSGVTVAHIGRWVLGMKNGVFTHANIEHSPALPDEVKAGWIFHFVIGGAVVATAYPLYFLLAGAPFPEHNLLPGLVFGLATSLLPWLLLLPCFGWGFFGTRAPAGAIPLLASTVSHIPYGVGVGLAMNLGLHGRLL